jgi:uncharacterized protein (DUF1330 family)
MAEGFSCVRIVLGRSWKVRPRAAPGVVMIEFPSMEDARAWYNEPEYAPLKKLRQTGAKLDLILVESLPPGSRS